MRGAKIKRHHLLGFCRKVPNQSTGHRRFDVRVPNKSSHYNANERHHNDDCQRGNEERFCGNLHLSGRFSVLNSKGFKIQAKCLRLFLKINLCQLDLSNLLRSHLPVLQKPFGILLRNSNGFGYGFDSKPRQRPSKGAGDRWGDLLKPVHLSTLLSSRSKILSSTPSILSNRALMSSFLT